MAASKKTKPPVTAEEEFVLVRQPSTRTFRTWSPDLILAAEAQADAGSLRLAAELCDALLGDDRLGGVLETRIDALLGLVPTFEEGTGRRRKRAAKALDAEEDWWEIFPEDEHSLIRRYAILLGVGPVRLQYFEETSGKRVARYRKDRLVPLASFWHPKWLRQDIQTGEWFTQIEGGREEKLTPGDGTWALDTPYGKRRPWVYAPWRALARLWMLKQCAINDSGRAGERAAAIKIKGAVDAKIAKDGRAALAESLSNLGRDGVISLPAGWDCELMELSASTPEIYQRQIEMVNTAYAVTILANNLTAETKGGSLAAATSGKETLNQRVAGDAAKVSTFAHAQVLPWWAEYNFGDRAVAPWPVYPVEPPEDGKAKAEEMKILGEAVTTLVALEPRVDRIKILEAHEVPLLAEAPKPPPVPVLPQPAAPAPPVNGTPPAGDVSQPPKKFAAFAAGTNPAKHAIAGQLYTDAVIADAADVARSILAGDLDAVQGAIARGTSYAAIQKALMKLYREMSAEKLAEATHKGIVMADLAGRHGVDLESK